MERLRRKELESNERKAAAADLRRTASNPVPSAEELEEWEVSGGTMGQQI